MKDSRQIRAEIDELRAKQREIIARESDAESDKEELWEIEGRCAALEAQYHEVAEIEARDLEEARAMAARTTAPSEATQMGRVFAALPKGEEFAIRAALTEGSGSGSYLVPQEWHERVERVRFERSVMRQAGARVIRTESTHNIPVLSALATAAITGENVAYTASDPTISQVVLYAWKYTLKTLVSEELLLDAVYPLDEELAYATGVAFGKAEDKDFLTGDGSSKPTGIFNKTADKTLAGTTAITKDELIEILYGLERHYRDGAAWFMHDSTALYVAKLKLDVATSGTTPYFWTDAVGGEPPKLLGYPVYTNSNIATIAASAKTICFGNAEFYVIGERGPMVAKRLTLNEYGDTFAFHQRLDGKPLTTSAFYVAAQHA